MTESDPPAAPNPPSAVKQPPRPRLLKVLGPGLITGASDDDPSGIATYSQAGAQFGFDLGWTLLFTWPLMCAIQEISARIGRVTGRGIGGNLKKHYPIWLVYGIVSLLVAANVINLGADLGAMGAAVNLLIGNGTGKGLPIWLTVTGFALISMALEIFVRYSRYVSVLKWLTLSLFTYVGVAFVVRMPWGEVAYHLVLPQISLAPGYLTVVVAILGTTISPYLFFWQAEEEVEEVKERPNAKPLVRAPEQAREEFSRIRWDTYIGMGFSNAVALFIVLTTAATLHAHGVTDIQTSSQAALALKPIAGPFTFVIFALGIIGTGLLALPVLAGSAAYAVGEAFGWHVGLARKWRRAPRFNAALAVAFLGGAVLNVVHIDPIKALFWSAVINGVVAVPLMVLIMHMASRKPVMGDFKLRAWLKTVGWIATAVMAAAAVGMFATMGA
jgi:NRAMP (natural resistance-associated macrophage protein)-like metal ion transporter